MNRAEWHACDDAWEMLKALRRLHPPLEDWDRPLHRYYLACCRRIWKLLPEDELRLAIGTAERYAEGGATDVEYFDAIRSAEGCMCQIGFCNELHAEESPPGYDYKSLACWLVEGWARAVSEIRPNKLRRLIGQPDAGESSDPRKLLEEAAGFAFYAIAYPTCRPRGAAMEHFRKFLSARLLREIIPEPSSPHPKNSRIE